MKAARGLPPLLCAAFALAACASGPREELPPPQLPERAGVDPIIAARAEGVRFLAYGTAPMYHLRFYEDRITFSLEGAAFETYPRPEPLLPRWHGEIYETANGEHRLEIRVRRSRPCPTHPGYVVVEAVRDGVELAGCGRDV